jgi:hypothetical protein
LIGSDKVEGTSVYGADETQIGTIECHDRQTSGKGRPRGSVLWLLVSDDYYPLPWVALRDAILRHWTYEQLQGAPKYGNDSEWNWEDQFGCRQVIHGLSPATFQPQSPPQTAGVPFKWRRVPPATDQPQPERIKSEIFSPVKA